METKKFFSELSFTFRAFGRLLRKAFNHKNKTNNSDFYYSTICGDPYVNSVKAYH